MDFISYYNSPLGKILISSDNIGITGLWFEGQKYYALSLNKNCKEMENVHIKEAKHWLDIYFNKKKPEFFPNIHLIGSEFQVSVWNILKEIPYGQTTTYNDIAKQIAKMRKISKMSARAVGSAVGHNKISIIIPCHRVIGSNNSLTGYAGGIDKKKMLLTSEGIII